MYLSDAEIIKHANSKPDNQVLVDGFYKHLLLTIRRRPFTVNDISQISGLSADEAQTFIDDLIKNDKIEKKKMPRGIFYIIKE